METRNRKTMLSICMFVLISIAFGGQMRGQMRHEAVRRPAYNIIVPQSRPWSFASDRNGAIEIKKISALIDILETTATTTIEIQLHNTTNRRQEAELIFPVPDKAVVRGFAYDGPGGEITAEVLAKDEAKRIYQQLVAQIRDPALVEFVGYNMIRSSVFPLEAHSSQKVRLTYEHLLESDGKRVDYVLPRTESLAYAVPWEVTANITTKLPISTVYSPSHTLDIERSGSRKISVKIATGDVKAPGPFRLSYLLEENDVTASLYTYPDEKVGGGYFLLLAGLPSEPFEDGDNQAIKREVTLVIDRSGSMRSEKIEQVKEAALQIIAGLKPGEAFNIIIYNNSVEQFSTKPVTKTKESEEAAHAYIEGVTATGGTNIYEALKTALNQKPMEGTLPIVLFLTDGLPTVGQTSEIAIRKLAMESNPYKRRIFTFGVGFDVNAPLLEKIADESRAKAEFVLPSEDVEEKIGKVFKRLTGPVLANVELEIKGNDSEPALGRVRDIIPGKLPDMFEGDQLVILGQYIGRKPILFQICGNYHGSRRTFKFQFELNNANLKNGFVPRLWASRKIAELIDAIRQMGADSGVSGNDPKTKELVDEIVRLSTEFGILTEYTAFLAREGTDLSDRTRVLEEAERNFETRGMRVRSGLGAVNQSRNMIQQKGQKALNMRNEFLDQEMNRVSITTVQQINDLAYYHRNNRWIDSRLIENESQVEPKKVVEFASEEFFDIIEKLARENRQGSIALGGDILLLIDGEPVLVKSSTKNAN